MKKKLSCVMAIITLMMGLGGCGGNGISMVDEDVSTVPVDTYEIAWYLPITSQKDTELVEEKINAYLKDKINATVKLYLLESSQYKEKMNAMISSGEYFDLAFCASWMLDYRMNAENEAFIPLDDYFDKYMPKTYELLDKDALSNAKVNGKIYALPVIKENAQQIGWIYRKDIADKYGINMDQIKNFEDLEPYAKIIKENEPDIQYPVDWVGDIPTSNTIRHVTTGLGLPNDNTYPMDKVIEEYETESIKKSFDIAKRYYDEGLVRKDCVTATDLNQRMKDGKTFCHLAYLKPGKVNELYKGAKYQFAQSGISNVYKDPEAGVLSMTAVSATSKNPARVMRFLELVNTDKYLNNLIIYGIEGKHYKKVSDNVIELIPDSGYSLSGSQWMVSNVFLNYTTTEEDPEKLTKLKEFDESAVLLPSAGFTFNTEPVQQYVASCATVEAQYKKQIAVGAVSFEEKWPEFKKKLEEAGFEKVKDELQKQYTEFLSKK